MNNFIKILTYLFVISGVVHWLMANPNPDGTVQIWTWIPLIGATFIALNIGYYFCMLATSFLFYRPGVRVSDADLPTCTVIIPAYNEGRDVVKTIHSALNSDYPKDKLRIIAIDDGSADNTWYWIKQCAAAAAPTIVTAIQHPKNSGKRQGIATGVTNTDTEIVITLDSDSVVTPEAFRLMSANFANPKVGAVAGNLRVSNLSDGLLPRMLDVCFVFNFDIMRSSQSVFNCVLCTPGALSAYRRSVLTEFLDDWLNESFMGAKAGIGEDRSLATNMLKRNYYIKFERHALASTKVPSEYRALCRMFLRWCRGDIRETIKMYSFIFNEITVQRLVIIFNMLMQTVWIITPLFMVPSIMAMHGYSLLALYCSIVVWATIPAIIYAKRSGAGNGVWAYSYALFYMVFLFWLVPYSLISIQNSRWMTRDLAATDNDEEPAADHAH